MSDRSSSSTPSTWIGARERLGRQVPGFNLTIWDCLQMQQLCAFENVASGNSKFCRLFTEDEWKGYAYAYTNGDLLTPPPLDAV